MKVELRPFRFRPIYLEKPWGGRKLASVLEREIPARLKIGESWEISDRGADSTPVASGEFRGRNLHHLIQTLGTLLLGEEVARRSPRRFPLLYKLLDIEALISLQVHPSDDYARRRENDTGKTEFWYILEAGRDAAVISGVRCGSKEEFIRLLDAGHPERAVGRVPVRRGDSFFIPPGRIHCLAPSCLLVEIQTNSDLTYRVHDWGRTLPNGSRRTLHRERALDVIDCGDRGAAPAEGITEESGFDRTTVLQSGPPFGVELIEVRRRRPEETAGDRFAVLTCVEGAGSVSVSARPGETWNLGRGDSLLLPAYLGGYEINPLPAVTLLKSWPEFRD